MHYYQFNIGDYVSHTRHLSLMEDLAFRRLLDFCYLHEAPLEGTAEQVARKIGMREHAAEVESVLLEFFVLGDDQRWHNARVERELAAFDEKREAAVRAGKASAKARAGAQRKGSGRSTVVQRSLSIGSTSAQPDSTQETLDKNQEPESTPRPPVGGLFPDASETVSMRQVTKAERSEHASDFVAFWNAYDHKGTSKVQAAKSWARIAPDAVLAAEIIKAATAYVASTPDKTYRKHPATWLNNRCWEVEQPKTAKPGTRVGGFDRFGKWQGVGDNQNYSEPVTEDNDPFCEHPANIIKRENSQRATKGLPPLTDSEQRKILNGAS